MFQPRPEPTFSRARSISSASSPSASSVMARQLSDQIHEPLDFDDNIPEPVIPPPEPRYRPQPSQARRTDMDWASWAARSQQVQERLAIGFERIIWGGIGALAGAAVGGVPAIIDSMRPGYPFVFSQSLGATVGAIGGILLLGWFRSRAKVERRRPESQENWTPRNQEASWN